VLYGMIGLLGAKIWIENRVNFADPVNLVPIAAGLTLAIGLGTNGFFKITNDFQLGGIALGTIVIIAGYHVARMVAPPETEGTMMAVGSTGAHEADHAEPHRHEPDE
jgi:xanthine/uracil permease